MSQGVSSGVSRPYGPLALAGRVSLAFLLFALSGAILLPILLLLLPWRGARIRAGDRWGNLIAPVLLAILGIRLDGVSRAQLEAVAPAIFVLNHTSSLDTILSMVIVPRGTVGVVKREGVAIPVFGQLYWLAGHLLIDRAHPDRAHASMDQLAEDVRRWKLSPWIGPEGTRSSDGRLGPFKKGFAHLALATGLPVVPLVLHDVHSLWPARTLRIAPGTVRGELLPPIPTTGWTHDTLTEHVAEVRDAIAARLGPNQLPVEPSA